MSRFLEFARARPHFEPSETVHITPSAAEPIGTRSWGGPDSWIHFGYSLHRLAEILWELPASRVDVPDQELSETRYDVALVLPQKEGEPSKHRRVRMELARQLGLEFRLEDRLLEVYVATTPNGPGPALLAVDPRFGGISSSSGRLLVAHEPGQRPSLEDLERAARSRNLLSGNMHLSGAGSDELCTWIERFTDLPVANEIYLQNTFSVALQWEGGMEGFREVLRRELGVELTPGRRALTFLNVSRAG